MTPEARVKAMVNRRMRSQFVGRMYRFMPVQNGMGAPSLDYLCCISGLFVAIETKAPGKHMTERQKATRDEIVAAGGMVFEISDEQTLDNALAQIELKLKFNPMLDIPLVNASPDLDWAHCEFVHKK